MKRLILASASPRRSELLKQLRLEFVVQPSYAVEEIEANLQPEEYVKELSFIKAHDVALKQNEPCLVIGADTIAVKDGILGKPINYEHAREMLTRLQNNWHEVITGITVVEVPEMRTVSEFEKTKVKMMPLDEETIDAYINSGEPMDKAGAYGIQGLGAILVKEIRGCYYNVVGLPVARLCRILEKFGIKIL